MANNKKQRVAETGRGEVSSSGESSSRTSAVMRLVKTERKPVRHVISCNHYRSIREHETCEAGVDYAVFKGVGFDSLPCFCEPDQPPNKGCSLAEFPTAEQIAAHAEQIAAQEAEYARRWQDVALARAAIVRLLGGPWKRGQPSASGKIDCPVCGATRGISFSRAGYNGHIHASCTTIDCVAWRE